MRKIESPVTFPKKKKTSVKHNVRRILQTSTEFMNETLRQKRWLQFSHCELSLYT
jgi:hypothetical protein